MNILIDAFGGDNAPLEILKGARRAKDKYNTDITLVGDTAKIRACAEKNSIHIADLGLLQADGVFQMETQPTEILKSGKNTSMAVGLQAFRTAKATRSSPPAVRAHYWSAQPLLSSASRA